MLRAVATASALALLVACSSSPGSDPEAPRAAPTEHDAACADLIVLGLRGQAQSPDRNRGVGAEVLATYRALDTILADRDVSTRLVAVEHPAAPSATHADYLADVERGRDLLDTTHRDLAERCPTSRFAIVGFSQGAHVVHAFAAGLDAGRTASVAVVGLIADPVRNPADRVTTWSFGSGRLEGHGRAGIGPPVVAGLRRATVTLCVVEDEICNVPASGGAGGVPEIHRTFYERPDAARESAEQLATAARHRGVG